MKSIGLFNSSLTLAALIGGLFGCIAEAKMTELTGTREENMLQAQGAEFDFSLISYYKPSDPDSIDANNLFDGAKYVFQKLVDDKLYTARSVGWFKIDIESRPELSLFEPGVFGQAIVGHENIKLFDFVRIKKL